MLRILPWITDGATEFIDNFITDRKQIKGHVSVFEFGSGNSTLYFLSRGCSVRSIEHVQDWVSKINQTAEVFGYGAQLNLTCEQRPYHKTYQPQGYDIVVIDGRDRMLCMKHILATGLNADAILVFDNSERADYKYPEFHSMMDLNDRDAIHFEQPQVEKANLRLTTKSFARDRAEHRWITSIFCPRGMYTTQGKLFFRPKSTAAQLSHYRALNDLDKKLEKYLKNLSGFFIEAGANDGIKQSNSYYFAKNRGWKGILVEAIPELFQRCIINRPESQVYHYALVASSTIKSVDMHYADLMSTVDGALHDDQKEHLARGLRIQNLAETYQVNVPAITLTALLSQYVAENNIESLTIDLFSLDVEGGELSVLEGLNLDKFRPRYILVECRDVDLINTYLTLHGYYQLDKLSYHDYLFADGQ